MGGERERERACCILHAAMRSQLVYVYEREREGVINTNRTDKKLTIAKNCVFAIVVFNQRHWIVYRAKPCALYGPTKVHKRLMIFETVSVYIVFILWLVMQVYYPIFPPPS